MAFAQTPTLTANDATAAILRARIGELDTQIASLNDDIASAAPHDGETLATLRYVLDFRESHRSSLEWHLAELLKAT